MKNSAIVIIVLAVLVVAGGWYAYTTYDSASSTPTDTTSDTSLSGSSDSQNNDTDTSGGVSADINTGVTTGSVPMTASVTLSANGFSPKSVTIKKGGTVTFTNESTGKMWVATASHPTHTVYDGTTLQAHCAAGTAASFDQCKDGSSYNFTFTKVGSFNYHNHSSASEFGTVVVVE